MRSANKEQRPHWKDVRDSLPKTPEGKIDKAACRRIYDASQHIEWLPFCHSVGWNTFHSRMRLPYSQWVNEKKKRLEEGMAAELSDLATSYRENWIADVKRTLEQYPRLVDNAMFLVDKMMRDIAEGRVNAKASEILALAATVKSCVEAKKSLLMLNQVVIKIQSEQPAKDEQANNSWTMSLKGGKDVTPKQLAELIAQYLDSPAQ